MEECQLRLVYAALYIGLGVIDSARTKEIEAQIYVLVPSTSSSSQSVNSSESGGFRNKQRRLPPLSKATSTFVSALSGMQKDRALDRWRWLTRDSSDKIVLRYIAQCKDTLHVLSNIAATIRWNVKYEPERELRRGEIYYANDDAYLQQYKDGKAMIVGHDRLGRPIITIRSALHHPQAQSKEAGQRLVVNLMTLAYMYQSEQHDGATIVFDMSNWTLANMDNFLIYFVLQTANKVFPMLVGTVFVHNAPKIFEAVWRVVKLWISPTISDRIMFTHSRNDLLALISIDNLPSYLGGMANDRGGWSDPNAADDAAMLDEHTRESLLQERRNLCVEFESLTRGWLRGEPNQTDRMQLAARQRVNYWTLDPYVRRRTVFDRQGLLTPPYILPIKEKEIDFAVRRQAMRFDALPLGLETA